VTLTHSLFGKIVMNRIVLLGHSRGGEAVAIANALNDLDRDGWRTTSNISTHDGHRCGRKNQLREPFRMRETLIDLKSSPLGAGDPLD
jgi:hypothetical protein